MPVYFSHFLKFFSPHFTFSPGENKDQNFLEVQECIIQFAHFIPLSLAWR